MPILNVIITLIVVGAVLWAVNTYLPMEQKMKTILNFVVVIAVVLWLLNGYGIFHSGSAIHIGG